MGIFDNDYMENHLRITKLDQEQRIVEGFATVEIPDDDRGVWEGKRYEGDLVDAGAVKAALPNYMEWANIREMHQPSAVGVVIQAEVLDGDIDVDGETYTNPLRIVAKIVDDDAWKKIKAGVYKGFSLGGKVIKAVLETFGDKLIRRITEIVLVEISLVDRPRNTGARILLWKADGINETWTTDYLSPDDYDGGEAVTMQSQGAEPVTVDGAGDLHKAADPGKTLAMLQELRNAAETGGDLDGAALYTQAIALLLQAANASDPEQEPEPEAESEPENGADLSEGEDEPAVMAEDMPEDEEPVVEMAQDNGDLHKAGRTFNQRNAEAMHAVIRNLAQMLAGSGDDIAQAVLKCYGPPDEEKGVQADDLQKMIAEYEPFLKAAAMVDDLQKAIQTLANRVDALEAQPESGGPVLRSVEKRLPGHQDTSPMGQNPAEELTLAELRKLASVEPNVVMRQDYVRRLHMAEINLAKRA